MSDSRGTTLRDDVAARCERLLAERGPRLRALAGRLLGQDADDGMQEVLAETLRSLPGFRGEAQLTTWFHRLALRVLCAFRARRDRHQQREAAAADAVDALSPAALLAYQATPLAQLSAAERKARVLACLERLRPPLREVLLLRGEGLDYAAIATTLQVPLGTVKSRLSAALLALAERLPSPEDLP